ncbi:RloB family protein [Acetobacter pasteurianus]|uniref:RloB domain-containing protein n=1 Tax=Acetobacter pasteurianus subsp. pasteurianus TaxID=481145 RepID=A0A1Y0XWW6_ACEPA|nr:RloB family protein [Acetobacter pasteurianus]ARW47388.1 hypothetical protein S1001342_01042 [Acetobacter pasteurianus subsp. pasteurianus]
MSRFSSLSRRKSTVPPSRRVYIFFEGSNSEPDYFYALERSFPCSLIKLVPIKKSGSPDNIVKECLVKKNYLATKAASYEKNDEIWAVFDKDDFDSFEQAVETCRLKNIRVGFSNPCFELWLVLHKKNYTKESNTKEIQKECEKLYPGYLENGKTLNFDKIIKNLHEAENRASSLRQHHKEEEEKEYISPSTSLDKLTSRIRRLSDHFPHDDSPSS